MAISNDLATRLSIALASNSAGAELAAILNGTTTNAETFSGGVTITTAALTITDVNVVLSATTGTQFGTATTQKLAFLGSTPIAQQANSVDLVTLLSNLGLRATGGNPPLNLGTGAIIAGNATLSGLLTESATDAITAHAGGTQAAALALTTEVNRMTVVATAGDSVKLPASAAGLSVVVINSGATAAQVYGAGTDTINDVATATGVAQMPNSIVLYVCPLAGKWYAEGSGGGYSGSLATLYTVGGLTATGGGQGGALLLTAMLNRVTTCGAGNGVLLPPNAVGMSLVVTNDGANALTVYPDSGAAINSLATNAGTLLPIGATASFLCEASNVWKTTVFPPREVAGTLTTNGAGTILAATIVGGEVTRTGLTAAQTDTTDTAANIIAAVHGAAIGQSWEFTYVNNTAFLVTFAAGSSVTLSESGSNTATCPQNSWVRFLVTVATATTVTMQAIARGPNSPLQPAKFTSINVTTGTLAAGNASGAAVTCLTSTNATPGSQAMRTPAQVLTDTPGLAVGMSYLLRITQTGAGTLTLATDSGTGFTMTGTMTVPTNTWRDFVVTINTATTGTVQSVGVGTFS